MQGKEADIVSSSSAATRKEPRARTCATSKPNLLNVAVTRARRRLYVICTHATWQCTVLPRPRPAHRDLAAAGEVQHLPQGESEGGSRVGRRPSGPQLSVVTGGGQ